MGVLVLVCAFLLFARAESYVLLTANVDDLHALANQVAKSPIVGQLKSIWRRAAKTFNNQYTKFRSDDGDSDESVSQEREADIGDNSARWMARRQAINSLVELGHNFTVLLRGIFDNL